MYATTKPAPSTVAARQEGVSAGCPRIRSRQSKTTRGVKACFHFRYFAQFIGREGFKIHCHICTRSPASEPATFPTSAVPGRSEIDLRASYVFNASNVPYQRPRAADLQYEKKTPSLGSPHTLCLASGRERGTGGDYPLLQKDAQNHRSLFW